MIKDEALKLALEFIEQINKYGWKYKFEAQMYEAITAIKEALAQPEQEPVVESFMVHMYNFGYKAGHHDTVEGQYIDLDRRDMGTYHSDIVAERVEDVGYHTTPPQRTWVGLTDEEIETLIHRFDGDPHTLLDEVNARLKEKNK